MSPFTMISATFGLAATVLAVDYSNPQARSMVTGSFKSSGAKFVSVDAKYQQQPKSMVEMVFDWAAEWNNTKNGYGQDGLAALRARTLAEQKGMTPTSFEDIASQAQSALQMAESMGVATGPTAFDSHFAEQSAANDPIARLNKQ